MSKRILVLGGGGHGRVVTDALLASGADVGGILDPRLSVDVRVFGVPVLGGDEFLDHVASSAVLLANGVGASPDTRSRKQVFEAMRGRGFRFAMLQHPSAVIGRESSFGEGCQTMAGAVVQSGVQIGDNVVVNSRASVDHDCVLGPHCFVAPGAVLCGEVTVSEAAFVGAGAVVLPGVAIGENAVVGAGAVVTKAVHDGCIVAGNPAVQIGTKVL